MTPISFKRFRFMKSTYEYIFIGAIDVSLHLYNKPELNLNPLS